MLAICVASGLDVLVSLLIARGGGGVESVGSGVLLWRCQRRRWPSAHRCVRLLLAPDRKSVV